MHNESEAKKVFKKAGLIPQNPFPGVNKSWKSMCKKCKKIVSPRLSTVLSGSGCKYCKRMAGSQKQKISKDKAEILFGKYNFKLIGNLKDKRIFDRQLFTNIENFRDIIEKGEENFKNKEKYN
jgi:hypothetical protein